MLSWSEINDETNLSSQSFQPSKYLHDFVELKDRKKRVLHVGEAHLNVPNSKKHCFDEKMPPF